MIISYWTILRAGNFSCRSFTENQTTHFMLDKIPPGKSFCLWDNVEKYGRARNVTDGSLILRVRFAWWVNKAADKHSGFVIRTAFPLQQWLPESASMLRYTYIAYLVVCWIWRYVKKSVGLGRFARSPFVTLLSRSALSGRWSSYGKRVCFTDSHLVLVIFLLLVFHLITLFFI